jgi:hypothetical protein
MNTFDFWTIKAICDRKTPMKKAGIDPAKITQVRAGWKQYGRNRYPIYRYEAYVGFVDAPEGREALNAAEAALAPRFAGTGVRLHVNYVCRD